MQTRCDREDVNVLCSQIIFEAAAGADDNNQTNDLFNQEYENKLILKGT
jgi:hypothetical protein